MIMGVVADDIAGSNDIGGMFAKAGYLVHIYTYDGPGALARGQSTAPAPDIAILDTSSRLDTATTAYDKVFAATRELQQAGFGILQAQSQRPVGLVTQAVLGQGAAALRKAVLAQRERYSYVILDVPDQVGLRTIAEAVDDFPVLCGSSALAEELPAVWGTAPPQPATIELRRQPGLGVLCVAGSLMPQTRAQTEQLRANGALLLPLEAHCLPDPEARAAGLDRVTSAAIAGMAAGRDVAVHSAESAASVKQTREAGARLGLSPRETARLVSAGLAEIAARVLERTGQNRLIVAGGETSAAMCARLGIVGQQVGPELQPGLPVCLSLSKPRRLLVLKSGSFGNPGFLQQALDYVKRQ